MSNLAKNVEQDCIVSYGCNDLKFILLPKEKDLGGFVVRRTLPVLKCPNIGPWIFFDHMGPAHFDANQGIDVRPHPHIGLATVTYLFEGEMLHRDSLGNEAIIKPGDINLMVAGKGIVHSERQRAQVKAAPQTIHGLQLWLALPTELERTEPNFYHYDQKQIPEVIQNGVTVRIMMGHAYGISSPVKTLSETLYIEARLAAGQSLILPDADERGLYVVEGNVKVMETTLQQHSMAVLTAEEGIKVTAKTDTKLIVVGGKSVGKRFLDWNFVASDLNLIKQAKLDWSAGGFPKVPGDDKEFIPLPS
jgi:redox-sensitive bicupin YhaK (pirin superfamily)